jgi:hypothetical protein
MSWFASANKEARTDDGVINPSGPSVAYSESRAILRPNVRVLSAGESQVIADLEPFTIEPDTSGLELLVFRPPEPTQTEVTARRRTYLYFGGCPRGRSGRTWRPEPGARAGAARP